MGESALSVRAARGKTVIDSLRQSGSSKLLFPRQDGADMQAVLINTAGGVTNGDRFTFSGALTPDTTLTLTTQAAERAYRASGANPARIRTSLTVDSGATLHWLPQETILFDGCCVDRTLSVDIAPGARALVAETLVFGRAAMGEVIERSTFRDRIEIRQGRTPRFVDAFHLTGDAQQALTRPFGLHGAGAMTTLVLTGPTAEAALDPVRDLLPETAGASLIAPDLLVARLLAPDSFALRQSLLPLLGALTGDRVPRPWMI